MGLDARQFRKSKYIKSTDITDGEMPVTIADVRAEQSRSGENVLMIAFDEIKGKSLSLNGINIDSLTAICGTHDVDKWIGRKVVLFNVIEPKAQTGESVRVRRPSVVSARAKPAKAIAAEPADGESAPELSDDIPF